MELVKRVWKDPVGSKLIADGILWAVANLFAYFASVKLSHWVNLAFAAVALVLVGFAGIAALVRKRSLASSDTLQVTGSGQAYQIDIHTEEDRPYHELTSETGHVLSTVRVGIRNAGEKTLSNCRVYVERISPLADPPMQNAILLESAVFNLRVDDPEHLVEIAAHWDHMNQFRFSAPVAGGFYEALQYMDDDPKRTFVIRVAARECERSALFEISVNESKRLHLTFLNYLN